jgi:protein-S-isoprenylcysteine O-methyltransferase Ste14
MKSGNEKPLLQNSWWKGARGEWYVVIQVCLILVVATGPRTLQILPKWSGLYLQASSVAGWILLAGGAVLSMSGIFKLGPNLTPVPYPKEKSTLIQDGPYRLVRHPIYSGLVLMCFGWGLMVHGWLTLIYATVLFAFFDVKSRREEAWLREKFSEYAEYQKRVHKLVPWLY